MNRREYLALLGITVLAGCSESASTPETTTTPPTTTDPTPTPEATETETAPTTTEEPPETETETETESENPNVAAARDDLERARELLNSAVEKYVTQADPAIDDPVLTDVGASTDFEPNDVIGPLNIAYDRLNRAERITNGQLDDEITRGRDARQFLLGSARIQYRLSLAYGHVEPAITTLHDGGFDDVEPELSGVDDNLEEAQGYADEVPEPESSDWLKLLDAVDEALFQSKTGQWEDELNALDGLRTGLVDLATGIQTMTTAMTEYTDGDDQYTGFAPRIVSDGRDAVAETPKPESLADELERIQSLGNAFAEAASAMDNAAIARSNENDDAAGRYECDAREAVTQYEDYRDFQVGRSIFRTANCPG